MTEETGLDYALRHAREALDFIHNGNPHRAAVTLRVVIASLEFECEVPS